MPELSLTDLSRIARQADLEVKVVDGEIQTKEGSWGGRAMRGLKVGVLAGVLAEDRTEKREGYAAAKNAVLQALKREYGDDVGERAFLAGAGRRGAEGGVESSADHPLTGRQIRRMIEHAESEREAPMDLTKDRLEALALTGDRELTHAALGTSTQAGSLGGRVARGVKIAFGPEGARDVQRTEYSGAKNEILHALQRAYGPEVAKRAFIAGAGYATTDGEILSSADHPLTGDRVGRMLDHARTEAARFDVPQPRLDLGAGDWARQQSGLTEGGLETGQALVEIERGPYDGMLPVDALAGRLLEDMAERQGAEGAPRHLFWSVALGDRGSLAIHLDRDDPGVVHVLDPGRREARVPKDELAGWLAAHLGDAHGEAVGEASLHRAEMRFAGLYGLRGERWVADAQARAGGPDFAERAKQAIAGQRIRETLGTPLSSNFVKDVDRATILVVPPGGRPERLTQETAVDGLRTLVGSGDPATDAVAMRNLSKLLNQELPKESLDATMPQLVGGQRQLLTHMGMEDLHITASRIETDGGPVIEIACREGKQLGRLVEPDGFNGLGLDPRTDTLRTDLVLRVPLATLQDPDWDGTLQRPTATTRLHLERDPGRDPEPDDLRAPLTFMPGADGVARAEVSMERGTGLREDRLRLENLDSIGSLADEAGRGRVTVEAGGKPIRFGEKETVEKQLDATLGLDRKQAMELQRLLAPGVLQGTLGRALEALGLEEGALAGREVQVTRGDRNGVDCLDIDIRWRVREGELEGAGRGLGHWGEPPEDDARHVIAVRLSVPVKALEADEAERFVLLGGPTVERRPR